MNCQPPTVGKMATARAQVGGPPAGGSGQAAQFLGCAGRGVGRAAGEAHWLTAVVNAAR